MLEIFYTGLVEHLSDQGVIPYGKRILIRSNNNNSDNNNNNNDNNNNDNNNHNNNNNNNLYLYNDISVSSLALCNTLHLSYETERKSTSMIKNVHYLLYIYTILISKIIKISNLAF